MLGRLLAARRRPRRADPARGQFGLGPLPAGAGLRGDRRRAARCRSWTWTATRSTRWRRPSSGPSGPGLVCGLCGIDPVRVHARRAGRDGRKPRHPARQSHLRRRRRRSRPHGRLRCAAALRLTAGRGRMGRADDSEYWARLLRGHGRAAGLGDGPDGHRRGSAQRTRRRGDRDGAGSGRRPRGAPGRRPGLRRRPRRARAAPGRLARPGRGPRARGARAALVAAAEPRPRRASARSAIEDLATVAIPPCDLVNASLCLPFLAPDAFQHVAADRGRARARRPVRGDALRRPRRSASDPTMTCLPPERIRGGPGRLRDRALVASRRRIRRRPWASRTTSTSSSSWPARQ